MQATLGEDVPLGFVRQEELRCACAALGVTDHFLLGGDGRFADSGYDRKQWDASSFASNVDSATIELISFLRAVNPDVLVTFDRGGCTGHPDHVVCHEIGLRAATELRKLDGRLGGLALIADPLRRRLYRRRSGGRGGVLEIDITAVRDQKEAAVRCHFSQVGNALDDRTRLALFDRGSAVARYVPHTLSKRRASRYERFVWITAEQLAAAGAA